MQTLANYSLLTRFPLLQPNFASEPPVSIVEFWRKVQDENPSIANLIQAIFLSKEILHLEQIYAGQTPTTTVMVPKETLMKWPKDPHLAEQYWPAILVEKLLPEKWSTEIWPTYFQYAWNLSRQYHSCWSEWLMWDWQLKYGFSLHRSANSTNRLSWLGSIISLDLESDQQQLINTYYKISDPWQAEFTLDQARWQKIRQISPSFSFDNDELVVYALQLLLLERWWFISQSKEDIFSKVING